MIDYLKKYSDTYLPFELDFLRAIGFEIGLHFDGDVDIQPPESIDVGELTRVIVRFEKGIRRSLLHEGEKALSVCVGGPFNGRPHWSHSGPYLLKVKRASWAVYGRKDDYNDPRCWFIGMATSEKKGRELYWKKASDQK